MKKRSLLSRFFRRERQIPFSIKSVLSFYLSLMGRYWYLLAFMSIFTLFYSAITALRLGFISIVVDGLPTVEDGSKGQFAKYLIMLWDWGLPQVERTDSNLLVFLGAMICSIGLCAAACYYIKDI